VVLHNRGNDALFRHVKELFGESTGSRPDLNVPYKDASKVFDKLKTQKFQNKILEEIQHRTSIVLSWQQFCQNITEAYNNSGPDIHRFRRGPITHTSVVPLTQIVDEPMPVPVVNERNAAQNDVLQAKLGANIALPAEKADYEVVEPPTKKIKILDVQILALNVPSPPRTIVAETSDTDERIGQEPKDLEFVDCEDISREATDDPEEFDIFDSESDDDDGDSEQTNVHKLPQSVPEEKKACIECEKVIGSEYRYKRHLYRHIADRVVASCPFETECGIERIVGQRNLHAHLKMSHDGYGFCRSCKKFFETIELRDVHVANVHPFYVEEYSPKLFSTNVFVNDDSTLRFEEMPLSPFNANWTILLDKEVPPKFNDSQVSQTLLKIGSFGLIKTNEYMQPIVAYSMYKYVDKTNWPKRGTSTFRNHPHHEVKMPDSYTNPKLQKNFQKCHIIPFADAPTPAQAKATMAAPNMIIAHANFNSALYKIEKSTREHGKLTGKPVFITTFIKYPDNPHTLGTRHLPKYIIRCEVREKAVQKDGKLFDFCAWQIKCSSSQTADINDYRIGIKMAEELAETPFLTRKLLDLVDFAVDQ
jgi:hypothetical protein